MGDTGTYGLGERVIPTRINNRSELLVTVGPESVGIPRLDRWQGARYCGCLYSSESRDQWEEDGDSMGFAAYPEVPLTPDFEIREILDVDVPDVVTLLCEGFPRRSRAYWQAGLRRLAERDRPSSLEKYGHALVSGDSLQGVVLTIPSVHEGVGGPQTLVNISSWYVRPSFRGGPAKELYRYAARRDDLSYTNLSAVPHTIKTITSFGFREWTAGQMVAMSLPWGRSSSRRSSLLTTAQAKEAGLPQNEVAVLEDHERFGCFSLCLETTSGLSPLVFLRRHIKDVVPCAQLIYCRDLTDLVHHGPQVWGWLVRRGYPLMLVDASAPVPGLTGRYVPAKASKYIKGPLPAKAIDHTYSEMVLLGF